MFSTISSFLITWWMRQTEPLNRLARFSSESLRVGGTRAVTGTSVNDGWWTGQAEPDGSSPSGSSVQCTCTNEDPEADTATMPLSLSLCDFSLTSTDILLQIVSCWLWCLWLCAVLCLSASPCRLFTVCVSMFVFTCECVSDASISCTFQEQITLSTQGPLLNLLGENFAPLAESPTSTTYYCRLYNMFVIYDYTVTHYKFWLCMWCKSNMK